MPTLSVLANLARYAGIIRQDRLCGSVFLCAATEAYLERKLAENRRIEAVHAIGEPLVDARGRAHQSLKHQTINSHLHLLSEIVSRAVREVCSPATLPRARTCASRRGARSAGRILMTNHGPGHRLPTKQCSIVDSRSATTGGRSARG